LGFISVLREGVLGPQGLWGDSCRTERKRGRGGNTTQGPGRILKKKVAWRGVIAERKVKKMV
jgi:hypothetical protein